MHRHSITVYAATTISGRRNLKQPGNGLADNASEITIHYLRIRSKLATDLSHSAMLNGQSGLRVAANTQDGLDEVAQGFKVRGIIPYSVLDNSAGGSSLKEFEVAASLGPSTAAIVRAFIYRHRRVRVEVDGQHVDIDGMSAAETNQALRSLGLGKDDDQQT